MPLMKGQLVEKLYCQGKNVSFCDGIGCSMIVWSFVCMKMLLKIGRCAVQDKEFMKYANITICFCSV